MSNYISFFCLLVFLSCSKSIIINTSVLDNTTLDKYIYPTDTIYTEGYIIYFRDLNNIAFFTIDSTSLTKDKGFFINNGNPIFVTPSTFYEASKNTLVNTAQFNTLEQMNVLKVILEEDHILIEKVKGRFIIGVTSTKNYNSFVSDSYYFKNNYVISIITDY